MAAFRSSGAMPFWACTRFFGWCEDRGLTLTTIRPFDVAAWIEQLQEKHGAAGVKQQLAALRMKVEDLRPKGAGWQIQLHEKGGVEGGQSRPLRRHRLLAPSTGGLKAKKVPST